MPETKKYTLKEPQIATVDDLTLHQGGESVELTDDQVKRLRSVGNVKLSEDKADDDGGSSGDGEAQGGDEAASRLSTGGLSGSESGKQKGGGS